LGDRVFPKKQVSLVFTPNYRLHLFRKILTAENAQNPELEKVDMNNPDTNAFETSPNFANSILLNYIRQPQQD
jgi:hypothetical protein